MRKKNPNRSVILFAMILTVFAFNIYPILAGEADHDTAPPAGHETAAAESSHESGEAAHEEEGHGGGHGHETILKVLFALIVILLAAKFGGEVFERMNQPGVIGELLFGVLIGNAGLLFLYYGEGSKVLLGLGDFIEWMKSKDGPIDVLAQIGVVFLLFEVGLETNVKEMMSVGISSLMVALFGVVAPFALGWGIGYYFLPDASWLVHMFIGATLTATSVGITARVLKDLNKINARESKIILGAAVIDDVMGLIILAVAAGIIGAAAPPMAAKAAPLKHGLATIAEADLQKVVQAKKSGKTAEEAFKEVNPHTEKPAPSAAGSVKSGGGIEAKDVAIIIGKAIAFLFGSIIIGLYISPRMFHVASRLRTSGMLLIVSICFCFLLAGIAAAIQLAPIVGAFAAGLILESVHYRDFTDRGEHDVEELINPISIFLVPIFFVIMGMRVDLTTFGQGSVLVFALVLTIVAIIGKQVCSFGVMEKGLDRISVGVGMIPRGEVGLIFADYGMGLFAPMTVAAAGTTYYAVSEAGSLLFKPVIDSSTYSAVVIMVIVTTLVTPFVLAWTLKRGDRIKKAHGVSFDADSTN
ncbi:MAG: cation:proton antiporter [Planctomycetota bacterium]|jgi:Kef-type K+ transport system membrane component KefB